MLKSVFLDSLNYDLLTFFTHITLGTSNKILSRKMCTTIKHPIVMCFKCFNLNLVVRII